MPCACYRAGSDPRDGESGRRGGTMTRMINKKMAGSWLLLLSIAPVAGASEEEAVLQALHAGCAAFEKGDAAALARLLDEKFTLTDSRGTVTTLEENLAEVRNREPRYE